LLTDWNSPGQINGGDGGSCPGAGNPLGGDASALAFSTRVAGALGWLKAGALGPGDRILTFDNGLQPVTSVKTGCLWDGDLPMPEPLRPLAVPHGALGNAAELLLLPEQIVMLESDIAETLFGDPFALVTAAQLHGFRGIRRVSPEEVVSTVRLTFDEDQLVFAGLGAVFYCPAASKAGDLTLHAANSRYRVLRRDEAQALILQMSRDSGFDADPFDPSLGAPGRMRVVTG